MDGLYIRVEFMGLVHLLVKLEVCWIGVAALGIEQGDHPFRSRSYQLNALAIVGPFYVFHDKPFSLVQLLLGNEYLAQKQQGGRGCGEAKGNKMWRWHLKKCNRPDC